MSEYWIIKFSGTDEYVSQQNGHTPDRLLARRWTDREKARENCQPGLGERLIHVKVWPRRRCATCRYGTMIRRKMACANARGLGYVKSCDFCSRWVAK
jgi:hypothetical protein